MTVSEIMGLIKDKDTSVNIYDDDTNKILKHYSGNCRTIKLDDITNATVKVISYDGVAMNVFIKVPTQKYYTYLDITYSTRIELEVPVGADERELLEKEAEKLMGYMPDGLCIHGHSFSYDYDNIQSGGFEDMIEKC